LLRIRAQAAAWIPGIWYRPSDWDAAIVAATEIVSAKPLYIEDLNHGQQYDPVRGCNPFIIRAD
jgi:predicted nucleic acid-binding protein